MVREKTDAIKESRKLADEAIRSLAHSKRDKIGEIEDEYAVRIRALKQWKKDARAKVEVWFNVETREVREKFCLTAEELSTRYFESVRNLRERRWQEEEE